MRKVEVFGDMEVRGDEERLVARGKSRSVGIDGEEEMGFFLMISLLLKLEGKNAWKKYCNAMVFGPIHFIVYLFLFFPAVLHF